MNKEKHYGKVVAIGMGGAGKSNIIKTITTLAKKDEKIKALENKIKQLESQQPNVQEVIEKYEKEIKVLKEKDIMGLMGGYIDLIESVINDLKLLQPQEIKTLEELGYQLDVDDNVIGDLYVRPTGENAHDCIRVYNGSVNFHSETDLPNGNVWKDYRTASKEELQAILNMME